MSDQSGESSNQEEGADATEDYNEDRDRGARRLLRRLTLNEWLTLFVGFLTLVVSFLGYLNAADTSDLKRAVNSLTALSAQTKRQADAANQQIAELRHQTKTGETQVGFLAGQMKASREQAENTKVLASAAARSAEFARTQTKLLNDAGRPWLIVGEPAVVTEVRKSETVQFLTVMISAIGQRPALHMHIVADFFGYRDGAAVQEKACQLAPTANSRALEETIFPGQRVTRRVAQVEFLALFQRRVSDLKGVAGCVLYADADGKWHETGFSYLLAQPKDDPYGNPVPVDLDAASEHPDDPIEYKVVPDPRGAGPIT